MQWQDILIALAGLAFSVGLVPAAFGRFRPPRVTALTMVGGLILILVSVASLALWTSMAATALQLSLWAVVAYRGPTSESKTTETISDRTAFLYGLGRLGHGSYAEIDAYLRAHGV